MRIRQFSYLLTTGAIGLLLGACGSDDGREQKPEKATEMVPCTVTVLDIRQGDDIRGYNHSYFVRYRVHVPGRPAYEGSREPVLNTIQVAQIVAVSKNYPCQVSRSDPDQVQINWDTPLTASPSPTPK
ncbi:hypothetical protein [Streptomyces sp. P17]|uniref:hypothetical protein n=1 Tax=Streptomyces sp. P17 TaxID=3074716 RepID=UPI0028F44083|nr:hypothetical protein [Streptomyces sp. P17]MDT9698046.1 hypothetical protein [Streptomyces sp. P17]